MGLLMAFLVLVVVASQWCLWEACTIRRSFYMSRNALRSLLVEMLAKVVSLGCNTSKNSKAYGKPQDNLWLTT
jgi:hypothetical protein